MPTKEEALPEVYAKDRDEWCKWLADNGKTVTKIWLVYHKVGSGTPSVTYAEAVEEALCYGWIDSRVSPVDTERYKQIFTPRKPSSVWSKLNKTRVAALETAGKIMPEGWLLIEAARQDGSWNALDATEDLQYPDDFLNALRVVPNAYDNFMQFSPSAKKNALRRILTAKRAATREKWIAEITMKAARNEKVVP